MHDDRHYVIWLEAAIEQAEESWRQGGIPIGSVLVDAQGTIVARGRNLRVQSGDPTAHAEIVCLRNAGRRRDWRDLTLVSTLSPCAMCSGAVILYGIRRVVVGESRTFTGEEAWMKSRQTEVIILDDERCRALMQRLQRQKPDLWAEDIGQ